MLICLNTIFLIIYFIICLLSVDILSPPFIGHVARYTPSSRPKIASKIKANLELHKSLDDFYKF